MTKNGWIEDLHSKRHYVNNQYHNDNGPAVIWNNGNKYWYKHHKWHRDDGPAVEYADGSKSWYVNDKFYSEEDFKIWRKFKAFL